MNKAYLAIIGALGIPIIRSRNVGASNKSKEKPHPSQVFGQLYKDRVSYSQSGNDAKYKNQPKYSDEILKNVANEKILTELKQLFVRDRSARQTFETIVSDFYLRPKYWQGLFNSIVQKQSLFVEIPGISVEIDPEKLNPTVNSQFFDGPAILGYSSKDAKIAMNKKADLFKFFNDNNMLDLATRFYAEYIYYPSGSKPRRMSKGILFWSMILNSVIADLASKTTIESVKQAYKDRKIWIERNELNIEKAVKRFWQSGKGLLTEIPLNIDIDGKPVLLTQNVFLERSSIPSEREINRVAKEITRDALDNWIFGMKIKTSSGVITIPVTSVQYVSKIGRSVLASRRVLTDKGRPAVLAQEWVERFIKGEHFTTLISSFDRREMDLVYTPATIEFASPQTSITIKRTSRHEAEQWIKRVHNALPKFPVAGLLDIIGAYDFEDNLMGIMVLNTPPHARSNEDAPGQYHIVDISRIAVENTFAGRGIAVKLAKWAIENKELYNRSAWHGNANVVTYSMLQESGVTYIQSGFCPTRLSRPGAKHSGSTDMITQTWKIKWESNPFNRKEEYQMPKVKWWLTKLHRAYVKWTQCHKWDYNRNCWVSITPEEKTLTKRDIQGLVPNGLGSALVGYVSLMQLIQVCGYKANDALQKVIIDFDGEKYTLVRFKNLMIKKGGNFEKAKQPVLDWINSQKRTCPHGNDILIAKEKRCD